MLNMAIVVICELVVAQLINQWRECLTRGPMKTTTEVVIKKLSILSDDHTNLNILNIERQSMIS